MGDAVGNTITGTVYLKEEELSEESYTWVFEPADGTEVKDSLSQITITFKYDEDVYAGSEVYFVNVDNRAVRVYDADGKQVDVTVDIEYDDTDNNVGEIYFNPALEATPRNGVFILNEKKVLVK
ncbi:MAG: copper resistance protein CopC [Prevotella sp.]|nr:copper resistance protein CopC [Prevotella sp.]